MAGIDDLNNNITANTAAVEANTTAMNSAVTPPA